MNFRVILLFIVLLALPECFAAHYIVGNVNDALDGTGANDHEVVLWNPTNGINDNLTDIIGPNGNSNTDNIYMIDCEMLNTSCMIGDEIRIKVFDMGDGYLSEYVSVIVNYSGFDVAPNITMNSPPGIIFLVVDDAISPPLNEIDLITNSTRTVMCEAIVEDLDGDSLQNATAEFFDNLVSFYGDSDDNNFHYTNNSCYVNESYGNENQSQVFCGFEIWYYANSQTWDCVLRLEDNLSGVSNDTDSTFVNPLLSIALDSSLDFGIVGANTVSDESVMNITNLGNVKINLSLSGYAVSQGDGLAMNCSGGIMQNISIDYKKYNLTGSIPGDLTLSEFEGNYTNLTSSSLVKKFNLDYRQNDIINNAINATYWRIYLPKGILGSCQGNIVVGAVVGEEN